MMPHLSIPVSTRVRSPGSDDGGEYEFQLKISFRALLIVGLMLHLIAVPLAGLIDHFTPLLP